MTLSSLMTFLVALVVKSYRKLYFFYALNVHDCDAKVIWKCFVGVSTFLSFEIFSYVGKCDYTNVYRFLKFVCSCVITLRG